LHAMLKESGNFPVPAVNVKAVADEIEKILALFHRNQLTSWPKFYGLTVAKAVDELIELGERAAQSDN